MGFRFLTAGESHGKELTAIVEGIPAGLAIDQEAINFEMARRQRGYGRGGRMKIETDRAEIVSGVRFGETIGSPVTLKIINRDFENWKDRMAAFGERIAGTVTAVRPGHADFAGVKKYLREDVRDILERSSARETAARVAVGALAKEFLRALGISVSSCVVNIGGIPAEKRMATFFDAELNMYDEKAAGLIKEKIRKAKEEGDTLGGVFEVKVRGVPVGLGSHIQWDKRLDARLAAAFMSIQAIKGVEIGEGFGYAELPGSLAHDEMFYSPDGEVYRTTNHAGGLEGGMTNGEEVIVRAVMKPIPTLMKPLHSVDMASGKETLAVRERSDVCAVPAASVVGEAMAAIVVADAVLEKFGGDAMRDVKDAMILYRTRPSGAQK